MLTKLLKLFKRDTRLLTHANWMAVERSDRSSAPKGVMNTPGQDNAALGPSALQSTTGQHNTTVGAWYRLVK